MKIRAIMVLIGAAGLLAPVQQGVANPASETSTEAVGTFGEVTRESQQLESAHEKAKVKKRKSKHKHHKKHCKHGHCKRKLKRKLKKEAQMPSAASE